MNKEEKFNFQEVERRGRKIDTFKSKATGDFLQFKLPKYHPLIPSEPPNFLLSYFQRLGQEVYKQKV